MPVDPAHRLIFALDVATAAEAHRLVATLHDAVRFYKVGLELFLAAGFPLVDRLLEQDKQVFLDLKLYDIPETVARAVRQIRTRPITFTTVHGDDAILHAACRERGEVGILAVTVLTSLDRRGLEELGITIDVHDLVLARARRAAQAGCTGVIASAQEARRIKESCGASLAVVTPGIRPAENRPADDQKRVMTVEEAIDSGSDHLVVGRPIRDAADPYAAAVRIQESIHAALAQRKGREERLPAGAPPGDAQA
ncbi:MAG TPA: orotidine-5'-phosphate decarboxylase [Acidobacteria bacterium]|nr:orotidine-5'-phosphate decarboxylase [Acidobacteriota bacterium]